MAQALRTYFDAGEAREAETPSPQRPSADIGRLIAAIRGKYGSRITGELVLPARPARLADFPEDLDARLRRALQARGVASIVAMLVGARLTTVLGPRATMAIGIALG